MRLVRIGDIRLNVVVRGIGQPLLLVHGFPLDHTMWQEQIASLSDCCRVIAPDLRGFGKSDVTSGRVTMEQMADDLAALLGALGIEQPVTFCGLSMGGYVAWQFWRRHAARLARLVLCDTRAVADTEDVAQFRLETAQRVVAEGPWFLAEAMMPKLFAPATIEKRGDLVEVTRRVLLAADPEGIAAALRGMVQRPDVTGWLARIDVPTLVLCGEHDAISSPPEMRGLTEAIPGARFVEIAGAGHMAPLEQPAAVNAAIREFLQG